jgi:hypothetical protein
MDGFSKTQGREELMRKHLLRLKAFWLGLLLLGCLATTASAGGKEECAGNICISDNGGISPKALPKHRQAPISAFIDARLWAKDGGHVAAARELVIDFDKTLQVNAKGLPACKKGQLMAQTTGAAKEACPDAIVGSGEGEVEVAFPEQQPFSAKGPIVLFNGGIRGGATLLYIHAYVAVPTPTAIVATVRITRIHRGRYGIHTVTQVPIITGGAGSVAAFKVHIGRRFTYKGKRQSYLTASCPTGHYFTEGKVTFSDGTKMGLTHILPCTPKA